jgi:Spy/CpxP family protein refolding chaperone
MVLKIKLTGIALSLGFLVVSAPVFAQQPQAPAPGDGGEQQQSERGPRQRRRGPGDMHMLRQLGELQLTEAQQQQARAIIENHLAAIKPQREELLKLREQPKEGANETDVQSRAQALRAQIHESAQNMRSQLLALLTPDQRAKLDQMEMEHKARREQMRERRRQMPESDQQQQ